MKGGSTYTRHLIRADFEEVFRDNTDQQFIDIGESMPFYEFDINRIPRYNCTEYAPKEDTKIRPDYAPNIFTRILTEVAAAYHWKPEAELKALLERVAEILKSRFIGYHFTEDEVQVSIARAIQNRDNTDVMPNTSIRVLTNPYFQGDESSGQRIGTAVEELKRKKQDFVNRRINETITNDNYQAIHEALCDYDLNQGLITHKKIAAEVGVNEKTIRRHLKDHPDLREIYDAMRDNSGKCKKRTSASRAFKHENPKSSENTDKQGPKTGVQKTDIRPVYNTEQGCPENAHEGEIILDRGFWNNLIEMEALKIINSEFV